MHTFFAVLKSKHSQTTINMLKDTNGNNLTSQDKIEEEVMNFYRRLVGEAQPVQQKINIEVLRDGR